MAKLSSWSYSPRISHILAAPNITIGQDEICPSTTARNLGVIIDSTLSMSPHVAAVCKAASFQLHRISRICRFLTTDATKTLVHSLISSRVDYCNSVHTGLPDSEIHKLQCIMNAMAHLTSRCHKFDHITPILVSLHWLPVRQCITFKDLQSSA